MLERFKYISSTSELLEFGKDCLFVNENDLRDFEWGINSKNNRISGFTKGIVTKTIPIILKCDSETEGLRLRNRLFEVFEKDVLLKQHGKILIGDYYLRCYITGTKKTEYLIDKTYMVVTATVTTDFPEWVRETKKLFQLGGSNTEKYLDFPYDFSYDFKNPYGINNLNNSGLDSCNFIMTIYGKAVNPQIYIGGHEYLVNVTVEADEYLVINSIDKTIVLHKGNGETVNCFKNRNRNSYVFEKIPTGDNPVASGNSQLLFEITLLEERGEPKWN